MNIPNVKSARNIWSITKIEVNQHNQVIDNLRIIIQPTLKEAIKRIKNDGYLIGLSDYHFTHNDEKYALHMSLINHSNIKLDNENGRVKYTYINSSAKNGLGIQAYGLNFIPLKLTRKLRKEYHIYDDYTFKNICFILNMLIGYAVHNGSSISNKNILNLDKLANQLFMNMDDFLVALTTLKFTGLIRFDRVDHKKEFYFKFYDFLANDIETIINNEPLEFEKQCQENEKKENILIMNYQSNDLVELTKLKSTLLNYFENKGKIDYILLPKLKISPKLNYMLRTILSRDPNIAFRPNNWECEKKIQYAYKYINENVKQQLFDEVCIYRFIPTYIVKAIYLMYQQYPKIFLANPIDTLWIYDLICRKFIDISGKLKFNGSLFKTLGCEGINICQTELNHLHAMGFINLDKVNVTSKQISFDIELTHRFDKIKNDIDLLSAIKTYMNKNKTWPDPNQEIKLVNIRNEDTIEVQAAEDSESGLVTNIESVLNEVNNTDNANNVNNKNDIIEQINETSVVNKDEADLIKSLKDDNAKLCLRLTQFRIWNHHMIDFTPAKLSAAISKNSLILLNKTIKLLAAIKDDDDLKIATIRKQIIDEILVSEKNMKKDLGL